MPQSSAPFRKENEESFDHDESMSTLTFQNNSGSTRSMRDRTNTSFRNLHSSISSLKSEDLAAVFNASGPEEYMEYISPRSSSRISDETITRLQAMTINKLKFSELGLYGRDDEVALLNKCYTLAKSSRQLVLLSGGPGNGKTSLTRELKELVRRMSGLCITGKLQLRKGCNEPYGAIIMACEKLYDALIAHKVQMAVPEDSEHPQVPTLRGSAINNNRWLFSYDDMQTKLIEELSHDEITILKKCIPILEMLLERQPSTDQNITESHPSDMSSAYVEMKHQFTFAFVKFFRIVNSFFPHPIALIVEDLQWSDLPTLQLIDNLLADRDNSSLMIVVEYRDNEVDETHPLFQMIQDIESHVNDAAVQDSEGTAVPLGITKILVPNLQAIHVNQMLSDLLSVDLTFSQALADIVHTKTLGNPLFVRQYLNAMTERNLLTFNMGQMKWKWDVEEIKKNTTMTDNVVDLMQEKLKRLPSGIHRVLPLIACLGSSFPISVFNMVVDHFNEILFTAKEVQDGISCKPDLIMSVCIEQGIIEINGEWHRWVHDKIQEAALSLSTGDNVGSLQFQLGELLLEKLSPEELQRNLFVTINLLNNGVDSNSRSENRRLEIAKLNLRAAVSAAESCSFAACAEYATKGIALLPDNHWSNNYVLSLDLFSTAAQAEYNIGNFPAMQAYCDKVLAQVDRPLLDKRRVYNAMLDSIGAQDRMGDAWRLCLDVLAQLGCKISTRFATIRAIAGIVRTKMAVKNRTPAQILKYTAMTDESKVWTMILLDKLFTFLYQDKSNLVPLAILKSFRWTIKYGVSDMAMPNFASVGFMLNAFMGDFKAGEIYAKHSLEMMGRFGAKRVESRTLLVAYGSVLHWTTPLEDCMKPLHQGYRKGLQMGDIDNALWNIYMFLWFSLFKGTVLKNLAIDLKLYADQMLKHKHMKHLSWTLIFLQTILNLMGESDNTIKLTGFAMDEDELLQQTKDIGMLKPALNIFQMCLMFFFDQHDDVVQMINDNGASYFDQAVPGVIALPANAFHSALSCISMARSTKNRKYNKLAMTFCRKIKGWVNKGVRTTEQWHGVFVNPSDSFTPNLTRVTDFVFTEPQRDSLQCTVGG